MSAGILPTVAADSEKDVSDPWLQRFETICTSITRWREKLPEDVERRTSSNNTSPATVDQPTQLQDNAVLEAALSHFTYRRNEEDFPRSFYDATEYDVDEDQQVSLWRVEIQRLLDMAEPLEFLGFGDFDLISEKAQFKLSKLADVISATLNIITLDIHTWKYEFAPQMGRQQALRGAQEKVQLLSDQYYENTKDILATSLFDLVNFITDVAARILCSFAKGDLWRNYIVSGLAQMATKIKILAMDIPRFAVISFRNSQTAAASHPNNGSAQGPSVSEKLNDTEFSQNVEDMLFDLGPNQEKPHRNSRYTEKIDQDIQDYYVRLSGFELIFNKVLSYLISVLQERQQTRGLRTTAYETCAVVYKSGFNERQTLLFQDGVGCVMGTSRQSLVNLSFFVFKRLEETSEYLQTKPTRPRTLTSQVQIAITKGDDLEDSSEMSSFAPKNMNEIVTIFILSHMLSPALLNTVNEAMSYIMLNEETKNAIRREDPKKFTAFFVLQAAGGFEDRGYTFGSLAVAAEKTGLKQSIIRGNALIASTNAQRRQMKKWIIEEQGIRISCRLYSFSVMAICAVFVFGGIAIGLTVHNRIPGVDPFNLASYSWLLAGFIAVVSKALRVSEWPWRDFLRGIVFCRTVSEVRTVTGFDEQLIIAMILEEESHKLLNTRGLYNCIFRNRSDDGFSIDVPISLKAMIFSGLIMVQVQTPEGQRLVCLDVRRKFKHSMIEQRNNSGNKEYITSIPMEELVDFDQAQKIILEKNKPRWLYIIGIYDDIEKGKFI